MVLLSRNHWNKNLHHDQLCKAENAFATTFLIMLNSYVTNFFLYMNKIKVTDNWNRRCLPLWEFLILGVETNCVW